MSFINLIICGLGATSIDWPLVTVAAKVLRHAGGVVVNHIYPSISPGVTPRPATRSNNPI